MDVVDPFSIARAAGLELTGTSEGLTITDGTMELRADFYAQRPSAHTVGTYGRYGTYGTSSSSSSERSTRRLRRRSSYVRTYVRTCTYVRSYGRRTSYVRRVRVGRRTYVRTYVRVRTYGRTVVVPSVRTSPLRTGRRPGIPVEPVGVPDDVGQGFPRGPYAGRTPVRDGRDRYTVGPYPYGPGLTGTEYP